MIEKKRTDSYRDGLQTIIERAPKGQTVPKAKAKPADDGLTQSERFIKAAQDLGTDDDPERFAERVRKIGGARSAGKTNRAADDQAT